MLSHALPRPGLQYLPSVRRVVARHVAHAVAAERGALDQLLTVAASGGGPWRGVGGGPGAARAVANNQHVSAQRDQIMTNYVHTTTRGTEIYCSSRKQRGFTATA